MVDGADGLVETDTERQGQKEREKGRGEGRRIQSVDAETGFCPDVHLSIARCYET